MQVSTLCLGALMLGDATGYEINKLFEDGLFSHFMDASYGSIYPALTRLTEQGMLTCTAEAQDGRPDKKVYSLTDRGRETLREALMAPLAGDKYRSEFVFASLFASMLPSQRMSEIVDRQLADCRKDLSHVESVLESGLDDPAKRFVLGYGQAVMKASIDYLEQHRQDIEAVASSETAPDGDGIPA